MIVATGTLRGAVTPSDDVPGTLLGAVSSGSYVDATLLGAVDRARADSYDAPAAVLFGARVELAGVDVTEDLLGSVSLSRSLDSPFARARFTLNGRRYGPHITETTWTRVGAVTITWHQGPAGGVLSEQVLTGVVDTCAPAGDRAWTLEVADRGFLYALTPVCYSVPPLAGYTRGQVARAIAIAAGIPFTDIPDGAPIRKPVWTDGRPVLEALRELGEPEGWYWRTDGDTLVAYTAELRRPPEPPDHVWRVDDLIEPPKVSPPQAVPSRWVVRGTSAVSVDELGQVTETVDFIVEGEYAPKVAVSEQAAGTGAITPTGFSSTLAFREISRVTTATTRRGALVVRKETREKGFYNPAHGKWDTHTTGGGSADDGFDYIKSYIDEDGNFKHWHTEKYVEVGRRVEDFTYDDAGTLASQRIVEHRWSRRTRGVRVASSPTINVTTAVVGDDDISYEGVAAGQIETYRQASEQIVTHTYNADGAETRLVTDSYGFRAPKAAINDTFTDHYVLSDGSGQTELTANYRLFERQVTDHILDPDRRVIGEITATYEYAVTPAPPGVATYDWGSHSAYLSEERFRLTTRKTQRFDVEAEDSFVEVNFDDDGVRTETRHIGSPPIPRHLGSPYRQLTQTNVDAVLEDDVLAIWFGRRSEIVEHPHIQSDAEALAVLMHKLRRLLSYKIEVRRHETACEIGDTVLVLDPNQGLALRALLVEAEVERIPGALGTYRLEAPLI